ncbi:hypothetical protein XH90_08840 [Bradyrhizobium sp. CCBAU 53338]|nr:hypothetical protein XH90_08840 [Bradyrhizobium sp. CCBAU 53338]
MDSAWISASLTGVEFIGAGTVGNGCGLERVRYLKHEDSIELESRTPASWKIGSSAKAVDSGM